jgi:SAM-dependent methyltransferase
MKRFLFFHLPTTIRLFARKIFLLIFDTYDHLIGRRPEGVPPRRKTLIGYEDYVNQGEKFLIYSRELAGLQPKHTVLDAGCGFGQMAVPLLRFLNEEGTYEGFDIDKSKVDWCSKNISLQHPNFRFQYTGPDAKQAISEDKTDIGKFIFLYKNAKFDFVFLTSAFTHLMPADIENYITEIGRVMKPGASCLMSFFIINCESEDLMLKNPAKMHFPFNKGFYRLSSLNTGDKNVAYDEEWLLEKLGNAGLKMESIQYGQWCGREHFFDYQDLLICRFGSTLPLLKNPSPNFQSPNPEKKI